MKDDGKMLIDTTTAPVPGARVVLGMAIEETGPTTAIVRPWARLEPIERTGPGAYLESEEAVADVAAALERHRAGTDDPERDRWIISSSGPWLFAFCMGAHEPIGEEAVYAQRPGEPQVTYPTRETVHVYFRPEGAPPRALPVNPDPPPGPLPSEYITIQPAPRYIVTDLGEAVRALRLRTGCALAAHLMLVRVPWPEGMEAQIESSRLRAGVLDDGMMRWYPTAADLPRAITRVMLAAHRVAALEVA